jgi:hypothetical protein
LPQPGSRADAQIEGGQGEYQANSRHDLGQARRFRLVGPGWRVLARVRQFRGRDVIVFGMPVAGNVHLQVLSSAVEKRENSMLVEHAWP